MEDDEFDWGEADDAEELVDYDYDDWDSTYPSHGLSMQPWLAHGRFQLMPSSLACFESTSCGRRFANRDSRL